MVLNELSEKLTNVMHKLYRSRMMNKEAIQTLVNEVTVALEEADVNQDILRQLKQNIMQKVLARGSEENIQQYVVQVLCQEITNVLDPKTKPYRLDPRRANIVAFYGLQGQGKTTTTAKYGAYHKRRGWRVGLVCCDTFRAGAFEQLKQNCTAAHLPYYGSYTEKDPAKLARDGVEHFRKLGFNLIILDTSGRHQQSEELLQEMQLIDAAVHPDERIFVVDASIGQAVYSQAQAFKKAVDIGSIILTKMDGSVKSGGALAAVSATRAPIVFIGTGEKFDQFEQFDAERYVGRLMGFGDMRGVIEQTLHSGIDHQKQAQTLTKMMEGEFSFTMFRQQLEQISKMGPLDKIIEMIPGMAAIAKEYGFDDDKEGTAAMRRWFHMMDSMTAREMNSNPQQLMRDNFERRARRIATGSGYTVERVRDFFKYAKTFSEQTKKFGKNAYGQNFKQILNLQQQAIAQGKNTPEQMEKMMKEKNMSQQQQKMMQDMMNGKIPYMPGIPGLGPGMDTHQAVQRLRSLGLLPDDPNVLKKAKKLAMGRK